jgi:hypothetical protein
LLSRADAGVRRADVRTSRFRRTPSSHEPQFVTCRRLAEEPVGVFDRIIAVVFLDVAERVLNDNGSVVAQTRATSRM